MSDSLMLVQSLDKDWEDSGSEQLDIDKVDPLEVASRKVQNSEDVIKEELVEELDPLAERSTELNNVNENFVSSIENVPCSESFDMKISPEFLNNDCNPKESLDTENSDFSIAESSVFSDIIDESVGETQRFVVHFDADKITLTPDNDSTSIDPDETVTCQNRITDMPDINPIENKKPQISIKRKKIVKPVCQIERLTRTNVTENTAKKKKHDVLNSANVPSVYSYSEIKRHKKRLTLKALQDDSSSDSDSKSSEDSFDPDLDVNLRIFEGSERTTKENVIIGEIHCDMVAEDINNVEVNGEKQNKNTNVFKLSVNADFSDNIRVEEATYTRVSDVPNTEVTDISDQRINKIFINDDEDADDINEEDVNGLSSLYNDDFFSSNDSDLEILTSKSISRKRSSVPFVRKERPIGSDKRTMYDLIYDTMVSAPKSKEKPNELKSEQKKTTAKKPRTNLTKKKVKASTENGNGIETVSLKGNQTTTESNISNNRESLNEESSDKRKDTFTNSLDELSVEKTNDALPVPRLKVNADGEVIIDTDSLMIEQTGVAEARQAIANSEVVEESGLNYRSYSKKNNFRRQWSPHDTLKFYDVLSVVGTDFTLMATLFPGRTRNCIKRKYKREEKTNRDLIMKALTCKQKFNIGLLEKELKLKEEKLNLLKKNAKQEKQQEKARAKKVEPAKVKTKTSTKRKSFFERGISCFQDP